MSSMEFVFAGLGLIVAVTVIRSLVSELVSNGFKKKVMNETVNAHKAALTRRRYQLTTVGHYGETNSDKWNEEKRHFIDSVIKPKTGDLTPNMANKISAWIDELTAERPESLNDYRSDMSGVEYEHLIADELRKFGWAARVTVASGDQGIDVIAEKNGSKMVVQCKHYSGNVGNDAVQQIIAGKTYEGANFAAVVSNAEFTLSAKQLASKAGVFLLHHNQLGDIDSLCGFSAHTFSQN